MTRRRGKNRVNATGRNETSRFVRLDYRLLSSNAYRALSPNARSLLIELGMLFNGQNNGSLYLSVRDAAARLGVVDLTAAINAFDELRELGLIELTKESFYRIKAAEGSRARCWRLVWLPGPGKKLPDFSFYEREPAPKTRERKRMERGLRALKVFRKARDANRLPVLDYDTLEAGERSPAEASVRDCRSPGRWIRVNQPIPRDRHSRAHIAITMGDGSSNDTGSLTLPLDLVSQVADHSSTLPRRYSLLTLAPSSRLSWEPKFGPRNQQFQWRAVNDN